MEFLFDALKFGAAWFVGNLFATSITMIGCCLFCGLPILKGLKPYSDCIFVRKAREMYLRSISLHVVIIAAASWAVIRFAPEIMQYGFFFSFVFTVIIGFRQWGKNDSNVADFMANIRKYYAPGKEAEAEEAVTAVLSGSAEPTADSGMKSFFRGTLTTILIWGICRFLFSFVNAYFSLATVPYLLSMFAFLLAGWYITGTAVKWNSPKCLRANLYIFVAIEAIGLIQVVTQLMTNLYMNTGRYSVDMNGIAYSDYPLVYGGTILAQALYIWLCCILAGETKNRAPK